MRRITAVLGLSSTVLWSGQLAWGTDADPEPARFALSPAVSDGPVLVSIEAAESSVQGWSFSLCHDPQAARLAEFGGTEDLLTVREGEEPAFHMCETAADGSRAGLIQAVVLSFQVPMRLPVREGGFPVLNAEYQVLAESAVQVCDGLRGSGEPVPSALTLDGQTYKPAALPAVSMIQKPYAGKLTYRVEPPESSEVVTVTLASEEIAIEGWSFALCNSAQASEVVEMAAAPELERLVNGEAPEFILNDLAPADPFVAVKQSVLLGTTVDPVALGPFPDGLPLLNIRYRVTSDDDLKFCDRVGNTSFDSRVLVEGIGYVPRTRLGARLVTSALGTRFIRGDANLDGRANLSDAVFILMALFLGGGPLPCLDAADANDVGRVDISDPIFLLRFLFMGGPEPTSPFPQPGEDLSSETALGCERGL